MVVKTRAMRKLEEKLRLDSSLNIPAEPKTVTAPEKNSTRGKSSTPVKCATPKKFLQHNFSTIQPMKLGSMHSILDSKLSNIPSKCAATARNIYFEIRASKDGDARTRAMIPVPNTFNTSVHRDIPIDYEKKIRITVQLLSCRRHSYHCGMEYSLENPRRSSRSSAPRKILRQVALHIP